MIKNGENVFLVSDLSGNTEEFTVILDKNKPVIKGIKNGKTYKKKAVLYVKDACELSKVKINGKNQKLAAKQLVKDGKYKGYYKIVISEKGANKIVATDVAGNKKTLKIKIA